MSSFQDALQDSQEISHLDKLSKVIEAVSEAFNDGVDPQRIEKAIKLFLSKKQPLSASRNQSLYINQHDQHYINVAAASAATGCPNAGSLIRGLPYYDSAQGLTNQSLEAAGQGKVEWQAERKQRATHLSTPGAAKPAYEAPRFLPNNCFAATGESQNDAMIALNDSFDRPTCDQKQILGAFTFNNVVRPRNQPGDDGWVTLNNGPALFATQEEKQRPKVQEKKGDFSNIDIKDFFYKNDVVQGEMAKKELSEGEVVSKPSHIKTVAGTKKPITVNEKVIDKRSTNKKASVNSKKTTTAVKKSTAFDAQTTAQSSAQPDPVKRRTGRPVGYRKQANGKFAFPDGSTLKDKSQSSKDGGDKKRKAPTHEAAIGGSSIKRQRKDKGKGNKSVGNNEAVVEEKKKKEKGSKEKERNA